MWDARRKHICKCLLHTIHALEYIMVGHNKLRLTCGTHPWPPIYCSAIVFRRHQLRCHDCHQLSQRHVPSGQTDLWSWKGRVYLKIESKSDVFYIVLTNTIVSPQNIVLDEPSYAQILPKNFRTKLGPVLWHFLRRSCQVKCQESQRGENNQPNHHCAWSRCRVTSAKYQWVTITTQNLRCAKTNK